MEAHTADGWSPYSALQVHGAQEGGGSPRHGPSAPQSPPMVATSGGGGLTGAHFGAPSDDFLYGSFRPATTSQLRLDGNEPPNGVEITFRSVSVAVKRNCFSEAVLRQKSRVLVRAAIGRFPAGQMHGIVALSEESATALADVLSGRIAPVEGAVWADGLPARVALYRESVGVVRQLSWTIPQFTVEENLHFAGGMRRSYPSAADRQKRVAVLASVLGLDLHAKVRDLSPAAKRRVDVAMEMMAAPPVLFVHNPLWGLDCHSRADFSTYLSRVAKTFGTTIIMTLPKLELSAFDLLHSLIILGIDGHTVFSGRRSALAPYFISRVQTPLHQIPTVSATTIDDDATTGPRRSAAHASTAAMSREASRADDDAALLNGGGGGECVPLVGSYTARSNVGDNLSPLPIVRRHSTSNFAAAAAGVNETDDDGGETRDSRMPSLLSQRPATDAATEAEHFYQDKPRTRPAYAASPSADSFSGAAADAGVDLDGGDCVMDYVQLWGTVGATNRYAAAFFDSRDHQRLDRLIDEAVLRARSATQPARWLAMPLQQPSSLMKFGRLMYVTLKQRAVTIDWYVGWIILTVAVSVCLWLANVQSMTQEGLFNVRGIIFFMIAMSMQLNNTLVRSYAEEVERFRHLKASGVAPTGVQLAVTVLNMVVTRIAYLTPVSVGVIVVMRNDVGLVLAVLLGVMSWAHITIMYVVVLFVRTVRYASAINSAIDAGMLFFSGFLVNTDSPPASSFSGASLARYAYGATVQHMLRQQNYTCDGRNETSYCYTTEGYLKLEGFEDDNVNNASVSLAFFGIAATVIAFVRMWWL